MDQTKRPAKIPPEFLLYTEKHALFELFQVNKYGLNSHRLRHENEYFNISFFQRCISSLLIDRPNDPITYLIDFLKKDSDG